MHKRTIHTGWAKKLDHFLKVYNFVMVSDKKMRNMSKVCKFCLK